MLILVGFGLSTTKKKVTCWLIYIFESATFCLDVRYIQDGGFNTLINLAHFKQILNANYF